MNVNPLIEKIFKDFGVPIAFLEYTGKAETYLIYYTWSERPELFSDNHSHTEIVYLTIDIFSKRNFKNLEEQIKDKMHQNGFIWTENGPEFFEQETGYFHVPMNFLASQNLIKEI